MRPMLSIGVGSCLFAAACSSRTDIVPRVTPLHPGNDVTVTFSNEASDGDGIQRMDLYIYEYELYVGETGYQSARQRVGGQWGIAQSWTYDPATTTSVAETYDQVGGFPAASFVTHVWQVTDGEGHMASETWSFAAGDWPFGTNPIPLWGHGAPADTIDVAFIADSTDYRTARAMLPDLEQLIFDGYHINNGIVNYERYWSFYYTTELGFISDYDTPPLQMVIPASVGGSSIIDHGAVIHSSTKRDWASGGNFGTEPFNVGTAVHESGHSAFGLADEYSGGAHWVSSDPNHNTFDSQSSAETYNVNEGMPASDVQSIESGWWRPEHSSGACIMLNDGDAAMPDFDWSCMRRIFWFYTQL